MGKEDDSKFNFIDLFAGIGGMRIAFTRAKGKCVFSSEWDKYCQKTYFENFKEIPFGDIQTATVSKIKINKTIPDHDILIGGFPCQPFSSIGRREGFNHSTQGTLFYDIEKILNEKRPKAFLLENVPGLLTHDGGNTFKVIEKILRDKLRYNITSDILDAADYGLPQKRQRLYIVGFSNDAVDSDFEFIFPNKSRRKNYINKYLEENVEGYSISKHLQEKYLFKVDDGRPEILDKNSNIHVKTLVASYHKIQRLTGTFVRGGKTGLRLLTENECKAIMGFPKKHKIPVSRTQMYRQFGNSVAIPVVEKIAKSMVTVLEGVLDGKNECESHFEEAYTRY